MSLKKTLVAALISGAMLTTVGCKTTSPQKQSANNNTASQTSSNQTISYVTMTFPKQLQWVASQNQRFNDGGMVAGWVIKGYNATNSPVSIIYNKAVQTSTLQAFLQNAIKPLQTSCPDLKITNLKPVNSHNNQINLELICSRLGKNNHGTLYYVTAMADGKHIHMVRSETKTLASAKAGILNPRNQTERNMVNRSASMIGLMNNFRQTIKACDANNKCW